VIAIEIGAQNYSVLEKNIKVNNLEDWIMPLRCGIWSEPGEMEAEYEIYASHSLMPPDEHKHYTKKETVKTDTLDNIIDYYNLEVVDFINLQINGAEGEAIKGLERNFDKVKLLRIGAHYTIDGEPQDELIINQLKERGCTILEKIKGNITAATPPWASEFANSPLRSYFE
jgi:FkbM family methyltransferase